MSDLLYKRRFYTTKLEVWNDAQSTFDLSIKDEQALLKILQEREERRKSLR